MFCDGAKTVKELKSERIKELGGYDAYKVPILHVQTIAKQFAVDAVQGGKFKDVYVACSEQNKGLANSIICGVTDVINRHGRAIVLEDDLLTSPFFLKYMNNGLDYYQNRLSVYSISGYNYPPQKMVIPKDYEYDTYVSLRFCSWGWATWNDRWNQIDWSTEFYADLFKHSHQMEAFNRGGDDLSNMLYLQKEGRIDSWAIRCAYNQFVNHAVTIYPCISYIDNIGLDGTGVHCGNMKNSKYQDIIEKAKAEPCYVDVLYEDSRLINALYNVYTRTKRTTLQRLFHATFRKLGLPAPYEIKKKVYND